MPSEVPMDEWEAQEAGELAAELGLPPLPKKRRAVPIAMRLDPADLDDAKWMAEAKGLPYQTMLKGWIHERIEAERAAGNLSRA